MLAGLGGKAAALRRVRDAAAALRRAGARPGTAAVPFPRCCSFFSVFFFKIFFCVLPSSSEGFGVAEKIVLLTFISAVILMAILGNLLVMVAVCRDRQLR